MKYLFLLSGKPVCLEINYWLIYRFDNGKQRKILKTVVADLLIPNYQNYDSKIRPINVQIYIDL